MAKRGRDERKSPQSKSRGLFPYHALRYCLGEKAQFNMMVMTETQVRVFREIANEGGHFSFGFVTSRKLKLNLKHNKGCYEETKKSNKKIVKLLWSS
jgi:hypothetical protein